MPRSKRIRCTAGCAHGVSPTAAAKHPSQPAAPLQLPADVDPPRTSGLAPARTLLSAHRPASFRSRVVSTARDRFKLYAADMSPFRAILECGRAREGSPSHTKDASKSPLSPRGPLHGRRAGGGHHDSPSLEHAGCTRCCKWIENRRVALPTKQRRNMGMSLARIAKGLEK